MNEKNGDKRSVFTDALETLGTIITANEKRDAIHIAVIPCQAKCYLRPGEDVNPDGLRVEANLVGIVDPFLKDTVKPGEWFWLLIYPRKIKSLRHVWSHPAFPDAPEVSGETKTLETSFIDPGSETLTSREWIGFYANELGLSYEILMSGADEWIESQKRGSWGEYLSDGGTLEGITTKPEFWDHYAKVRKVEVPTKWRENFFSCSC